MRDNTGVWQIAGILFIILLVALILGWIDL
jgi:hypothetical protein